jgi:hypothetical protein
MCSPIRWHIGPIAFRHLTFVPMRTRENLCLASVAGEVLMLGKQWRGLSAGVRTVKKGYRFSRPQAGCHWPNSPCPGIIKFNYSRPGRVWSVTSQMETGKSINFFYSAPPPAPQHCLPRGGFLRLQTVLLFSSPYVVSSRGRERDQWELALFILANRKCHWSSFIKSL